MLHVLAQGRILRFLVIVLAALLLLTGGAEAKTRHKATKAHTAPRKAHRFVPLESSAPPYADLVIEARTGRVLRATNAESLRYPASLTKMMTLYLAFQALDAGKLRTDQRLTVSAHAAAQSPSKLGLRAGQSIAAEDAIFAIITESANDAAVVLAEAMGGSETQFAQLMTRQARALGMRQTVFRNASGLPDGEQVTTARDMAILGAALITHHARYYQAFSHESFAYAGRVYRNHNHLMERYEGMDGIKTGYIRASGFNLVASAMRNNTRLIAVVFGGRSAASRDNHTAELLDQGFDLLATPGATIEQTQAGEKTPSDNRYIALPGKGATAFSRAESASSEAPRAGSSPTNWGIQVGAYTDASIGQQALTGMARNMPQLLNQTDHILQKVSYSDGSTVYRARFMGMAQNDARSACSYMVRHGQGCLVIAPEQVMN
ncbi:MAG: D-alanyl-D-alanine carboxypeptidase [Alphaproteobacteria bacterium]|nr:D-alanyl-D-alanine carboxypeptidase [Alphaproteobacteria bacterium]